MPGSTGSGASSPGRFSSGSECGEVNTPFTERSVLFDDIDLDLVQKSINAPYILVVGGCGFIGSHTVWELAKAGYNVGVFSNSLNRNWSDYSSRSLSSTTSAMRLAPSLTELSRWCRIIMKRHQSAGHLSNYTRPIIETDKP